MAHGAVPGKAILSQTLAVSPTRVEPGRAQRMVQSPLNGSGNSPFPRINLTL